MHILLTAATPFELQPTLDYLAAIPPYPAAVNHPARSRPSGSPDSPASISPSQASSPLSSASIPPSRANIPPSPAGIPSPASIPPSSAGIPSPPAAPHHPADPPHSPPGPLLTRLTITPLITGVGSLSTTWSLMRQIGRDRPQLIIQAGIAGCFTGRKPGDVVAIQKETLADLGVWEDQTFKTLFDLGLTPPDSPPFTNGQLVNPYRQLLGLTALDLVPSITVNEITTDPTRIKWYQQNTDAVVESMEGGALHYVGLQEKIPFIQLRAISNDIGVRDKTKWDIRSAIANLNTRLTALLEKLNTTEDGIFK